MKFTGFFVFALILLSSCRSFFCPENTKFHFFTKEELSPILEHPDSILKFQEKILLEDNKTYVHYSEFDTVKWIDEKQDTVLFQNGKFCGREINQLCDTDIPMVFSVGGHFLANNFISGGLQIYFDKTIVDNDPIVKKISFWVQNYNSSDDIFDYNQSYTNVFGQFFSCSTSTVTILNTILENCLIFELFDKDGSRIIQMVYSKKYGFVKITTKEHEITRIL